MSEQTGEKTGPADAAKARGGAEARANPPRPEVQTTLVLVSVVCAISFTGPEVWRRLAMTLTAVLGHLHDATLTITTLQGYAWSGSLLFLQCTAPIVLSAMLGGLLAGGIQNRFNTASEALGFHWEKLNPAEGIKRVFSARAVVPALVAVAKFIVIFSLTYSTVRGVLNDPVFATSVSLPALP